MLTQEQIQFYEDNGYLKLGQTLTDDELGALQQRIDEIMLGKADIDYDNMLFQLDSESGEYGDTPAQTMGFKEPTLAYRKIQNLELDPLFLAYMQKSLFRDISRRFVAEEISVFRAMFMNKPARRGTVLPYHQDGGTQWKLDRENFVTVWTALDDATIENGCVQIIPGSHKLGLLSEFGHTITPEQEAEYCKDQDSIFLEAKAGEAFLLHNYTLHRSGVNTIERPRRAFSVVYMDAATRSTLDDRSFPKIFGDNALVPAG